MQKWLKAAVTAFTLSLLLVSWQFKGFAFSAATDESANQKIEESREKLRQAFNATVTAEHMGADVHEAVEKLNYALNYTRQAEDFFVKGDFEQAEGIAGLAVQSSEKTLTLAQELERQAQAQSLIRLITPIAALVLLITLGALVFLFNRRFWKRRQEDKFMEMKVKKGKGVTLKAAEDANPIAPSEDKLVMVAVLSALIVVAGLLVYVSLTPSTPESLASIYILNSDRKAGDYPEILVLNKNNTFLLYVGVENFMGRIEYSVVQVKVANGTAANEPLPEETVMNFEKIMINTDTWEFPVRLTLNQTGFYRISFELWLYDEMNTTFVYSGSKSGLWLEVFSET
jgi:hypothetical protein